MYLDLNFFELFNTVLNLWYSRQSSDTINYTYQSYC